MSQGIVYNIQRMSVQDGPGLRTTVFLKGCPLHCLWCSNPESQRFTPQVLFFQDLCIGCGHCMNVCPHEAVVQRGAVFSRDVAKCVDCGTCVESCPSKARVLSGKMMTVDEVMRVVHQDELFYQNSDGGVTFGGGEPTSGGAFFLDMLRVAHDSGLHVCVDTCGYCPEDRFAETIALTDLFLFDCKHMDPEQHERLTGKDNALILRNLRTALNSRCEVVIRMPLMPGLNDTDDNIAAMALFLQEYGRDEVEVMPYHVFGRSKYQALDKFMPTLTQYTPESLQAVLKRFVQHGLKPVIV
ncbi:MAG: glycyl-radical enzyme activating protein [Desulfovibrionaceae bacterium]